MCVVYYVFSRKIERVLVARADRVLRREYRLHTRKKGDSGDGAEKGRGVRKIDALRCAAMRCDATRYAMREKESKSWIS